MQDQYQEKDYNQIFDSLSKDLEENPIFNPAQFEHDVLKWVLYMIMKHKSTM